MSIRDKYTIEAERFKEKTDSENSWSRTLVTVFEVLENGEKKKLGSYKRNYHSMCNTFEPFEQEGKHYALVSTDYTTTSVLSLPECEIIATEGDWNQFGFCPTGFYVPHEGDVNREEDDCDWPSVRFDSKEAKALSGKFGFVCGCVWGDDNGWKIQFLDLSEINKGKVIRDDRFGYTELDGGSDDLRKAIASIYVDAHGEIDIELKGIRHYCTELKHKVGKKEIDINGLADSQAAAIISQVEHWLKRANENVSTKPANALSETSKKFIKQILYNTIVTVTEE